MKMISEIILASGSPRRKELLRQIQIEPIVEPSGADETSDIKEPDGFVKELSRRKCLDIANKHTNGVILGADTVVAIDGKILGKPENEDDAKKMIELIQGRAHHVYTGVTLAKKENGRLKSTVTFCEGTEVLLEKISREEIDEYVATGEPLDKAGAYAVQGIFAKFVKGIKGDYSNVVGLPLAAVYANLKRMLGGDNI